MSKRWAALLAWSLAPANICFAAPAEAQQHLINIPSSLLADAIRQLSDQTGVSVGFAGALPSIRTHEVRGAPSAAAALKLMLVGSDYRAITTGPSSFRIEREPVHIARGEPRTLPPAPAELPEIVVTALKRPQQQIGRAHV